MTLKTELNELEDQLEGYYTRTFFEETNRFKKNCYHYFIGIGISILLSIASFLVIFSLIYDLIVNYFPLARELYLLILLIFWLLIIAIIFNLVMSLTENGVKPPVIPSRLFKLDRFKEYNNYFIDNVRNIQDQVIENGGILEKIEESLNKCKTEIIKLEREMDLETCRKIATGRLVAGLKTVNIEISSEEFTYIHALRDKGTIDDMIINRLKRISRQYAFSFEVLTFIITMLQRSQRIVDSTWGQIKNKPKFTRELLELLSYTNYIPESEFGSDYQAKLLLKLDKFNIHNVKSLLEKANELAREIKVIREFLVDEGFTPHLTVPETVESEYWLVKQPEKLQLIMKVIVINVEDNVDHIDPLSKCLSLIYIHRFHRTSLNIISGIVSKDREAAELLFFWIQSNESRELDRNVRIVYNKWEKKKKSGSRIIDTSMRTTFDRFKEKLANSVLPKDIQSLFESIVDEGMIKAQQTLEIYNIQGKGMTLDMKRILPGYLIRKVPLTTLLRLIKKNGTVVYTINFKSGGGVKVADIVKELKDKLVSEGINTDWEKYLHSSRIGVIEGEDFSTFKEKFKEQLDQYPVFEKAGINLHVFYPNEELTLEHGIAEAKEKIKDLMSDRFDPVEILSTLEYQMSEVSLMDILNESTLDQLVDLTTLNELPINVKDYLKRDSLIKDLIIQMNCSNVTELIKDIWKDPDNYKLYLIDFLRKKKTLSIHYEKIVDGVIDNIVSLKSVEPIYRSGTFTKVLKQIECEFTPYDVIREDLRQHIRDITKIVSSIINYHHTIADNKYKETSELKDEYAFQNHSYNFLAKTEEIGADNIIREGKKGKGEVDFIIKGPHGSTLTPIELKFITAQKKFNYKEYIREKNCETKQYCADNNRNIGFLFIMDVSPQQGIAEADKASYYQPFVIRGGKSISPEDDPNPIGIIVVHLLGGKRTDVSKIKRAN